MRLELRVPTELSWPSRWSMRGGLLFHVTPSLGGRWVTAADVTYVLRAVELLYASLLEGGDVDVARMRELASASASLRAALAEVGARPPGRGILPRDSAPGAGR